MESHIRYLQGLAIALSVLVLGVGLSQIAHARMGDCKGRVEESNFLGQGWLFSQIICSGDCAAPYIQPCQLRAIGTHKAGNPPYVITTWTCTCTIDNPNGESWVWDVIWDPVTETYVAACDAQLQTLPGGAAFGWGCAGACEPPGLTCEPSDESGDEALRQYGCSCQ